MGALTKHETQSASNWHRRLTEGMTITEVDTLFVTLAGFPFGFPFAVSLTRCSN